MSALGPVAHALTLNSFGAPLRLRQTLSALDIAGSSTGRRSFCRIQWLARPVNDRLFPLRPILAVSAAVFRQGRVLIVRRARAPLIGHFSLPGGGVEVGETLAEAVARELMEEVGIKAEIIAFNRHVEAIIPEGERIRAHFVIASFVARWTGGEPRLSDEVDAIDWIDPAGRLALAGDAGAGGDSRERRADRTGDCVKDAKRVRDDRRGGPVIKR